MNADISPERCNAPVTVANVFIGTAADTGHRCQRAAGHPGVHRWSGSWDAASTQDVEAAVRAQDDRWKGDDDEPEDR